MGKHDNRGIKRAYVMYGYEGHELFSSTLKQHERSSVVENEASLGDKGGAQQIVCLSNQQPGLVNSGRPLKKRAKYAKVFKRAVVQIDNGQLCRLMSSDYARQAQNKGLDPVQVGDQEVMNGDHAVKDEPDLVDGEGMHRQIRTLKCCKCSKRVEMRDGKRLAGEGECSKMAHSELQILDIAGFAEKGISCPFVSSKKFHTNMVDEEIPEGLACVCPSTSDGFREEVLRILGEPLDKEEYRKHREAIKLGSYLHHHADLKRKLKKYRHQWRKCLIILRGFFYWLQNLTREGAFQPWTDKQCLALAVEQPAS